MHLDAAHLDASSVEQFTHNTRDVGSFSAILKSAIPTAPLMPYLEGDNISTLIANFFISLTVVITPFIKAMTLQVLFMAICVAIALSLAPKKIKKLFKSDRKICIKHNGVEHQQLSFLQRLFSVTFYHNHYVFCLLGLKMKFKAARKCMRAMHR